MISLILFGLLLPAVFCDVSEVVSVKKGDSVTLHTDIKAVQGETIKWFYNDIRIALVNVSYTCTDVQCNEGAEGFRDRLKLDHQTGSLIILNAKATDSGLYVQEIVKTGNMSAKTFNVTIYDNSTTVQHEMEKNAGMEGESNASKSGLSAGAKAGIGGAFFPLLVIGAATLL